MASQHSEKQISGKKSNIKLPLLRSMGKVYEKAKNCELKETIFHDLHEDLTLVARYFSIDTVEAFFISHVFAINYQGETADFNDLVKYMRCNPMKILEYSDVFTRLTDKGLLRKEKSRSRLHNRTTSEQYQIDQKVAEAILNDQPMPEPENIRYGCIIDLLEKINELEKALDDDDISAFLCNEQLEEILEENRHLPLIETMNKNKFDVVDCFLFMKLVWDVLNGYNEIGIDSTVRELMGRNTAKKIKYLQSFTRENNPLLKRDWVKLKKGRFLNEAEVELTEKSYAMLEQMGLDLKMEKPLRDNVVLPEKTGAKPLFYNPRETKELSLLENSLKEENFSQLQSRLIRKNLPAGLTILFYGHPGTGKTETVLQIAKKTGRDIFKVEISQSKSMWFGESEKVIKRIFTDYRDYARKCVLTPILLFNEADAIISKRKDSSSSHVAQTENAMQNIILEELENFEGIFMATTNLVGNLDKAFDRRFLFKISFDKPHAEVMARIWQSKMPGLSQQDCEVLTNQFNFSGGEIDNIVRKCETHSVIYGLEVDFESIMEFCRSETLENITKVSVGFKSRKEGREVG